MKNNPFINVCTNTYYKNAIEYFSKIVIIASGTYLDSYVLVGHTKTPSGPDKEPTTSLLSKSLIENGLELIRLKTGTPQRIKASSIDFSKLKEDKLQQLETWCNLKCGEIIFNSNVDGWSEENNEFRKNIFNKTKIDYRHLSKYIIKYN